MVPSPISLISSETAILLGLAAFPGFKDCRVSGCVPVKQCQEVTTPSVSPFFHKNPEPVAKTRSSSIIVRRTRSEEHTYESKSLMRNSYAVFCLKQKKKKTPRKVKNKL